jgi:hypothetical protein
MGQVRATVKLTNVADIEDLTPRDLVSQEGGHTHLRQKLN